MTTPNTSMLLRMAAQSIEALSIRLAALEKREPVNGKDGRDGRDAEVTRELILGALSSDPSLIREAVAHHLADNPPPVGPAGRDGAPGQDGKDGKVTVDLIAEAIAASPHLIDEPVTRFLKDNPPPSGTDGKDGADGNDGKDGASGKDGADGKDGVNGNDGKDGERGPEGMPGQPGRDGRDGKDGAPGIDGKDGLSIDDMTEEFEDDGRVLVRQFLRDGQVVKEFRHITKSVIYRGVWREGTFKQGDCVSFGGSSWIAKKDTETKPETLNSDWQLSNKRGRDGKDAK